MTIVTVVTAHSQSVYPNHKWINFEWPNPWQSEWVYFIIRAIDQDDVINQLTNN